MPGHWEGDMFSVAGTVRSPRWWNRMRYVRLVKLEGKLSVS